MAEFRYEPPDLTGVPGHERQFYSANRAFGRFGMRSFPPRPMEEAHWHGHIEANYITGASMVYDVDGQEIAVPENRLTIFWAGIPHQLTKIIPTGTEKPRLSNLYIPLDAFLFMPHIGQIQVSILGGGFALLPDDIVRPDQMRVWYADYRSRDFERVSVIKDEFNALLRRAQVSKIEWLRSSGADTQGEQVIPTTNIRHVVEMVQFILENFFRPLTVADVASVTGLHQNYALSLFTQTMRVPMKRFIIRMRLLRARALLLESSMAISSVSSESGFTSVSQFYEHFKRAYGMSPNMMRSRYATMRLK